MTRHPRTPILGWDIGGVNTKAVRIDPPISVARPGAPSLRSASMPFEIQRDPEALPSVLRSLATELEHAEGWPHAVTMTAELSQAFRTKREGVAFVLDAMARAFPADPVHVYTVEGRFVTPAAATADPLAVAASNWAATAALVARFVPDGILVDIGTTSTDIIPLEGGRIAARRPHRSRAPPEPVSSSTPAQSGRRRRRCSARSRCGTDTRA